MSSSRLALASIITLSVTLGACGGGGGGDAPVANLPPPPAPLPSIQSGVFKDANVTGLDYQSGQQSGVTDAAGRYECETGQEVAFSLGAIALGSTDCSTLASPPALVGDGRLDDVSSVNMARFLQLLDDDDDPRNGIVITEEVRTLADSWPAIDFAATDFEAELVMPLSDLASIKPFPPVVPAGPLALDHLDETLFCAYSGAFVGSATGTDVANMTLTVTRGYFFRNTDEMQFVGTTGDLESFVALDPYELRVAPEFDNRAGNGNVQIAASFETPDRVTGSWSVPPENASGTLELSRIGGDTAQFRATGNFSTDDGAIGVMVLDITGNTVTGEAFDSTEGVSYTIDGTLDGNQMTLSAVGGVETLAATATVDFTPDGVPLDIFGDITSGGGFFVKGCRLN